LTLKKEKICTLNNVKLRHNHQPTRLMYQWVDTADIDVASWQSPFHPAEDTFLRSQSAEQNLLPSL
jgi:hypothetical protein